MVLIIPALQIVNGKCSLLIKGEHETGAYYHLLSDNPVELCRLFRIENAKTLHISDKDLNSSYNNSAPDTIVRLSNSVDIPFQVEANFKSVKECRHLLDNGIYRVAIGELILHDSDGVKSLIVDYTSSRIAALVESTAGKINYSTIGQQNSVIDFIDYLKTLGFGRILLKEEKWQDINGVDFNELKKIGRNGEMRITLHDGINNAHQLWELNKLFKYGVDSLVIGEPLYENNFPCQTIWRMAESERNKDLKI